MGRMEEGGGGALVGCFYWLQRDGPITSGWAYKWGGKG